MLRLSISLICSILLATACASTPKIYVEQDPAADFASYRTYAFESPLGTDRDNGSQTILSSFLKDAISRELDTRGYRRSENPDLLVNAYVATAEKLSVREVPSSSVGYYGYRRGRYGAWGGYAYETHVDEYTEGTLTIDLVEVSRNQLVWEGTLVGRVTDRQRDNLQPSVEQAVRDVFSRFPARAAAEAPQPGSAPAK